MLFRPKYGAIGLIAMPYYLFFEALGPVVETLGYLFVLYLFLTGALNPQFFFLFLLLSVFFGIFLSVAALNLDDLLIQRYGRARDLAKMMVGSVLEFFGFRQLLVVVRTLSFITVLFSRGWGPIRRQRFGRKRVREES